MKQPKPGHSCGRPAPLVEATRLLHNLLVALALEVCDHGGLVTNHVLTGIVQLCRQ